MRILGVRLGSTHNNDLDRLRAAAPTYDHVLSTLELPEGVGDSRFERRVTVGNGEAAFAAARVALREWRPQRSLGASITPRDVAPDLGETVVLGLGVGPLRLTVPNRIVAVIDEPGRYGYAYGTLPGHPERGEELFLLEMDDDGVVVLTIRVDAEPARQLRRLGFVIRPLQRIALRRYLSAVVGATASSEMPS